MYAVVKPVFRILQTFVFNSKSLLYIFYIYIIYYTLVNDLLTKKLKQFTHIFSLSKILKKHILERNVKLF